jgi:hypothetical protein
MVYPNHVYTSDKVTKCHLHIGIQIATLYVHLFNTKLPLN